MKFSETTIPGCLEMEPDVRRDERGQFVKTFHHDVFDGYGLNTSWTEEYYSLSKQGVLRGLHFQVPPHDHVKLVYCATGTVQDVVLDMRIGSPSYGRYQTFELSAEKANVIYIPSGLAHGFLTLSETAIMMYSVSTIYAPAHDTGVLWSSVGIDWLGANPIVSERDFGLAPFSDFESPFVFQNN